MFILFGSSSEAKLKIQFNPASTNVTANKQRQ